MWHCLHFFLVLEMSEFNRGGLLAISWDWRCCGTGTTSMVNCASRSTNKRWWKHDQFCPSHLQLIILFFVLIILTQDGNNPRNEDQGTATAAVLYWLCKKQGQAKQFACCKIEPKQVSQRKKNRCKAVGSIKPCSVTKIPHYSLAATSPEIRDLLYGDNSSDEEFEIVVFKQCAKRKTQVCWKVWNLTEQLYLC